MGDKMCLIMCFQIGFPFFHLPYGHSSQKKSSYLIKITDFIKSLVLASLTVPKDLAVGGAFFFPQKKYSKEDSGKTNLYKLVVNLITNALGRRFATLGKDAALRKIHVTKKC